MINSASIINNSFQVFSYGIQYYVCVLAISFSPLLGAYITGPLFYKLNVTNIFEYLELRFQSKLVRLLATCCYLAKSFLHCAICIIGPSDALNILTGIHKSTIIILIGCLATIYSMLIMSSGANHGMKSIVWTNSIHVILTFAGVLSILIAGILNVNGGLNNIWYLNKQSNRLNLINFNLDPYLHQSFWSLNIGFGLYWLIFYSIDQISMQHFVSAKTLKKAQQTFLFNIPILFLFYTFTCLIGLVMFAIIYCSHINEYDSNKLVAYYFINNKLPGLSGLFVSSILAASFSSIISVLNSLSVIICSNNNNKVFKSNFVIITRIGLTFYFGLISILIAYLIELYNDIITQTLVSLIVGSIMAPISGIFCLGYLFKFVNKQGAITGLFSGLLIGFYLTVKFYLNNIKYHQTLENESCHSMNRTEILNKNNNNNDKSISYLWFICISFVITLIIGILISLITCGFKSKKTKFNIIQNKDNNDKDDEEIAYF